MAYEPANHAGAKGHEPVSNLSKQAAHIAKLEQKVAERGRIIRKLTAELTERRSVMLRESPVLEILSNVSRQLYAASTLLSASDEGHAVLVEASNYVDLKLKKLREV